MWLPCALVLGPILSLNIGWLTALPPQSASTQWEIWIGSQGGFTGGGSGYLIRSDGDVLSWTQAKGGSPRETKSLGHATLEALKGLEQAVTVSNLRTLKYQEAGNMTRFLEWRQGGDVREYYWSEHVGAPPPPIPLQRAYDAALAAVASTRR